VSRLTLAATGARSRKLHIGLALQPNCSDREDPVRGRPRASTEENNVSDLGLWVELGRLPAGAFDQRIAAGRAERLSQMINFADLTASREPKE
jgi:hypothetical protein